jgi:hypothetical protein
MNESYVLYFRVGTVKLACCRSLGIHLKESPLRGKWGEARHEGKSLMSKYKKPSVNNSVEQLLTTNQNLD